MCGLAGYFLLNKGISSDNSIIQEMINLQRHRGPDDSGIIGVDLLKGAFYTTSPNSTTHFRKPVPIAFGFNRLSILDLSENGHQPMISQDGRTALMMNGEIYNAFEYKKLLLSKGYTFISNTDTEVALHLYSEFGIEGMLTRLNGMFAFAIADLEQKKVFLARDRMGIKPLYLLRNSDQIAFSSELKSFKALDNFSFELDKENLDEFLLFRNCINKTLFKNINNLEPGSYCTIDDKGRCQFKKFYNINEEESLNLKGREAYDALERSLQRSVSRQLMSDVKLGCQLSGGVDSSLVTYYASKESDSSKLETVSIILDNPQFSEEKFIDRVASDLQLRDHKFTLDPAYYFDHIDQATWHFEQPLNHPNTIGIYLLSQEAKKHVTVLLSGEGADEALAGYGRFISMTESPYLSRTFLAKCRKNIRSLGTFLQTYPSRTDRMILSSSFNTPHSANKLYADFNWRRSLHQRREIYTSIKELDSVKRHRKYELLTYLPDLLIRQDKMSMAHSIENRVPFLDNEMISQSLNISDTELIAKHNSKKEAKKLLKDICSTAFSKDFAYRKKMGFAIPLRAFFNSDEFCTRWHSEFLPGIKERGVFNADYCDSLFKKRNSINASELDSLWLMTSFEVWAKQYLN